MITAAMQRFETQAYLIQKTLKPTLMRHLLLPAFSCILLTSCFTEGVIEKAKYDRRPEQVDSILSSYKDSVGNLSILYKKRNKKDIYKCSLPVESIIYKYRKSADFTYVNQDSTSPHFKGVFGSTEYDLLRRDRTILFDPETKLTDTSGLRQAIAQDQKIVTIQSDKVSIPISTSIDSNGKGAAYNYINTKVVGFIYHPADTVSTNTRGVPLSHATDKYIIGYVPKKRKYTRYLLVPFMVGLDVITIPFQAIGQIFGNALKDVPIS